MALKVKDWSSMQHFKFRSPSWIKLHKSWLDDVIYHQLSPMAGKYLPLIWLIASENYGTLPQLDTLSFRLRLSETQCVAILRELKGTFITGDVTGIKWEEDKPKGTVEAPKEKEKKKEGYKPTPESETEEQRAKRLKLTPLFEKEEDDGEEVIEHIHGQTTVANIFDDYEEEILALYRKVLALFDRRQKPASKKARIEWLNTLKNLVTKDRNTVKVYDIIKFATDTAAIKSILGVEWESVEKDMIASRDPVQVKALPERTKYIQIVKQWNNFAKEKNLPLIRTKDGKVNPTLKNQLKIRMDQGFVLEEVLKEAEDGQSFLFGDNDRGWKISLHWLLEKPTNYQKVLNGVYRWKKNSSGYRENNKKDPWSKR